MATKPAGLLTVEEAQERILEAIQPHGSERVDLLSARGRVLAEDVVSPVDLPPYLNSSMDGYAVRAADLQAASAETPVALSVVGQVAAGQVPRFAVGSGQAARIMTGAMIPEGTDAVVPVEDAEPVGDRVCIGRAVTKGSFVRYQGDDVRAGSVVLRAGVEVGAGEVGILASIQRSFVRVTRRPSVAILSTGDELADVDEPVVAGKIVNSNSYTLAAQIAQAGALPRMLGIARDREPEIRRTFCAALESDFVVSTGGVSVGDFDHVKQVTEELGIERKFWGVAVKPGKPVVFGILRGRPFFGLPGNPASTMVGFLLFVRPALRKAMGFGSGWRLPVIRAVLETDARAAGDRRSYLRGFVRYSQSGFLVSTKAVQESGFLSTMIGANGLVILETGVTKVRAGEEVDVLVIGDLFQEGP